MYDTHGEKIMHTLRKILKKLSYHTSLEKKSITICTIMAEVALFSRKYITT